MAAAGEWPPLARRRTSGVASLVYWAEGARDVGSVRENMTGIEIDFVTVASFTLPLFCCLADELGCHVTLGFFICATGQHLFSFRVASKRVCFWLPASRCRTCCR